MTMMHLSDGRAPFYVLGGFMRNPVNPWVLGLYTNQKDAQRAVNWQDVGQGDARDFRVCTFDEARKMFVPASGGAIDVPLNRGIYTQAAYGAFLEAHGIPSHNMMDPKPSK